MTKTATGELMIFAMRLKNLQNIFHLQWSHWQAERTTKARQVQRNVRGGSDPTILARSAHLQFGCCNCKSVKIASNQWQVMTSVQMYNLTNIRNASSHLDRNKSGPLCRLQRPLLCRTRQSLLEVHVPLRADSNANDRRGGLSTAGTRYWLHQYCLATDQRQRWFDQKRDQRRLHDAARETSKVSAESGRLQWQTDIRGI